MAASNASLPGPALRRVVITGHSAAVLNDRFGDLIRQLRRHGHKVLCVAPDLSFERCPDTLEQLARLGAETATIPFAAEQRIWSDYSTNRALSGLMSTWLPHAAIGMGYKFGPMSAAAATRAGAGRSLIALSGMADARTSGNNLVPLQKALLSGHIPLCANAGDVRAVLEFTAGAGTEPRALEPLCIAPAGVDLDDLAVVPLPPIGNGFVFGMAAPMFGEQGIATYCAAARIVRARAPQTRFLLTATNRLPPTPRTRDAVAGARDIVEDVGLCADLRGFLASAHVAVAVPLRDGLLVSGQTALALGRPLIVSNTADVRDLVDESVNGHRVDAGDEDALAEAMMAILRRKDLVPSMGLASRAKAVRNYDRRVLLPQMFAALGIASAAAGKAA